MKLPQKRLGKKGEKLFYWQLVMFMASNKWNYLLFVGWHTFRVLLNFICIKSHISTYKKCGGIIIHRAVNNLNVQLVILCLKSWTSQWHHSVRGAWNIEPWWFSLTSWASFYYISASVVYSVIIYYDMSSPLDFT